MALTDNLISHWKLDEASGTRNDSHGTNHLTDNNTVTSGTGKVGNCADFERDNSEYLSIADNASLSTGDFDFTTACWVNLESKTGNPGIVGKNAGGSPEEWRLDYWSGVDRFRFEIHNGGTFRTVSADGLGSPSTGVWYFIVAWHDSVANTVNIQVNDGTVTSLATSGTAPADGTGEFRIGRNNVEYFDGLIDELSFWTRTLTSGERTQLYNAGNGLAYPWDSGQPLGRRFGKGRNGLWLPQRRPIEVGRKLVDVY